MNFGMTVQAGAGIQPVGRGAALKGVETGQEVSDMPRVVMTGFAQLRRPVSQELQMIAPMNGMTCLAVLLHGRMFPEEWPAFFGMALVAKFIRRSGFDHLRAESPVRFMTVGALYLSLPEGMVRLFGNLAADIPVTGEAEIRLGGLEVLLLTRMDGMTAITGDTGRLVFAHVPEGEIPEIGMAGKALRGFDRRVNFPLAETNHTGSPAAPLLNVRCPRTMARLAASFIRRAPAERLVGMDGFCIAGVTVLVAHLAGLCVRTGVASPGFPGSSDPTHDDRCR